MHSPVATRSNVNVNVLAFALVSSLSLATAACSSGSTSGTQQQGTAASASAETAGSFCSTYCAKTITCDSSMDMQTCTEQCDSEVQSSLQKLRGDVVSATTACWQESDCRQVLGDSRLTDCISESVVSVAPSDAVKSFCSALSASSDKCDSSLNYADCLDSMKAYGDDTLGTAEVCTQKSCSTISSCVKATLSL